ncbi:hypothetical protein [Nesterenkonia suensis]
MPPRKTDGPDFRRIYVSIWDDPDFTRLPRRAQHLYLMLISYRHTRSTGVLDWAPGRFEDFAADADSDDLTDDLHILEDAGLVVADTKYAEVLIRTYMKHDYHLSNGNRAAGLASQFQFIKSPKIYDAMLRQLGRQYREAPDLKCWEVFRRKTPEAMRTIQEHSEKDESVDAAF